MIVVRSTLIALAFLVFSPAAPADEPDLDRFDCDRDTGGWAVFPPGASAELSTVADAREGSGALEYRYERRPGEVQALVLVGSSRTTGGAAAP